MELVPQDIRWQWTGKVKTRLQAPNEYGLTPGSLAAYILEILEMEGCGGMSREAAAVERLVRAAKVIDEMPIPKPSTDAYEAWVEACLELRAAIKAAESWEA